MYKTVSHRPFIKFKSSSGKITHHIVMGNWFRNLEDDFNFLITKICSLYFKKLHSITLIFLLYRILLISSWLVWPWISNTYVALQTFLILRIYSILVYIAVDTLPFGGVGHSGMGAYHGIHSFDTFVHRKSCLVKDFNPIAEKIAR